MNLSFFIARRYFASKKSTNFINIISGISVIGVAVGTAALIIVLSVFNGFEGLVVSLYNSFDPNIKITAQQGKTFLPEQLPKSRILHIPGVRFYSETLEDNALLKYRDKQYIATIKGVDSVFTVMKPLQDQITDGEMLLQKGDTDFAVIGQGVRYFLSVNLDDAFSSLSVFVPKRGRQMELNPEDAFIRKSIVPAGVFSIQQDFDSKYVLVPIRFARALYQYEKEVSAIEIGLSQDADMEVVQKEVEKLVGPGFVVQNRFQQHELLYKIMKSEKWAVFLILSFILLIATFNIVGSLTMLIIEKKKDIAILHALGADVPLVRRIFLLEGSLISLIGALAGLLAGFLICLLQQRFGIIKLQGSGSFVIDAYPVHMQGLDFVYVLVTVLFIGLLAAWLPAGQLTKKLLKGRINQ